jgi:tetratricopeptide (TPR) repeat protein
MNLRLPVVASLTLGVLLSTGTPLTFAQSTKTTKPDCTALEQEAVRSQAKAPQDPFTVEQRGDVEQCNGNTAAAITYYQTAIERYLKISPTQTELAEAALPTTYLKLAAALVKAEQPDEALKAYRAAINRDRLYGRLDILGDRQTSPLGEPITDGGIRGEGFAAPIQAEASVEASAYYELGRALTKRGSSREAVKAFRTALQYSPRFAYAYNGLGESMFRSFIFEDRDGIAAYRKALELNPNLVWARYNLGTAITLLGEPEPGFTEFRKVINAHTGLDTLGESIKDAMAYRMVGDVFLKNQGNAGAAIAPYRKAVQLDPQNGQGYLSLGKALLEVGNMQEAIPILKEALEKLPKTDVLTRAKAYQELGTTYQFTEQWEPAKAAFNAALSLDPSLKEDIQKSLDYINSR